MGHTVWLRDRGAHTVLTGGKLALVLMVGAAIACTPALAQTTPDDPGWAKKCQKGPIAEQGKDKKVVKKVREVCVTQFENFKLVTQPGGRAVIIPFVSASVRKIEGRQAEALVVSVPLGMAIAPGVRVAVVDKTVWLKSLKKEKFDTSKLKTIVLRYIACEPTGCTAEVGLKSEAVAELKKGAGLLIAPINIQRGPVVFKIPLLGFTKAYDGAPVDIKKHAEQRNAYFKSVIEQVRAQAKAAAKAAPKKK